LGIILSDKIPVVYPKEMIPKEETNESTLLHSSKRWQLTEIDAKDVENSLKVILELLEKIEPLSSKYVVDEAKLTIGVYMEQDGTVKAGLTANFLNLLKSSVSAEVQEKSGDNRLLELTLKRVP